MPEDALKALGDQRIAATRDRFVKSEGIQEKRLPAGEPGKPREGATEGAVEFTIAAGEDE